MLPVVVGAVAAAGSLLGDYLDQQAAKKAQNQAIQAYKALLIPSQETNRRADMYGDDVYTRTMGDLNSGAFAYAGALNPETIRTMAFSKMGVARSQVETGVREEDYKFNKGVQAQMAQIAAQPLPTIDVTGALGAGVGGYFAGRQLEMSASLMDMNASYYGLLMDDMRDNKKSGKAGILGSKPINYLPTDTNSGKNYGFNMTAPKISLGNPGKSYANPASLADNYPSDADYYKWKRQLLFK